MSPPTYEPRPTTGATAGASSTEASLGPIRFGVVLAVCAASVLGFVGLVDAVMTFDSQADRREQLSAEDLQYGYWQLSGLGPSREVVNAALAAIPPEEPFSVEFGPGWGAGRTRWTNSLTEAFLRHFLLPRRQSSTARWVLCFACDETELGGRFIVLSKSADGLRFGRLER